MCTNGEECAGSSHKFEEDGSRLADSRGVVRMTTERSSSIDAEVRKADNMSQVKDLELSQSEREMQRW